MFVLILELSGLIISKFDGLSLNFPVYNKMVSSHIILCDLHIKTYPTITLWLSLIDHAEYVITNSFHCCVFSLIFKKKFGVVPLNKTWSGMNSRIETLSELFGIKPRWIKQNDFSMLDEPVNCTIGGHQQFDISELVNE